MSRLTNAFLCNNYIHIFTRQNIRNKRKHNRAVYRPIHQAYTSRLYGSQSQQYCRSMRACPRGSLWSRDIVGAAQARWTPREDSSAGRDSDNLKYFLLRLCFSNSKQVTQSNTRRFLFYTSVLAPSCKTLNFYILGWWRADGSPRRPVMTGLDGPSWRNVCQGSRLDRPSSRAVTTARQDGLCVTGLSCLSVRNV